MSDDPRPGWRTVESSVRFGSSGRVAIEIPDDEMHHLSGEVTIKVSGADIDYPLPARLNRELEAAVIDAIEAFGRQVGADIDRGDGVETDGGTSPACPDCGSATISRRQPGHAMSDPWVDTRWRCGDCGHRFDQPAETRANPGRSGLAGRLDDADADDLDRGDGPQTDGGPGRARIAERAADRVRGALEDYLPRATRHRDSVDEADLEELIEWIADEVETDVNGRLRVLEREHYDHDLATDGGRDRGATRWELDCLDCAFADQVTTDDPPHDGPPREVEARVTEHKHTTDKSHVVRVTARRVGRDSGGSFDPSLLTDGGTTPCGRRTCDRDGTVAYNTARGASRVRCPRHALADGVDGVGESRAETILDAMDLETLVEIATDIPEGHSPVTLSSLPGFGPTSARSVADAVEASPVADAVRCDEEEIGDA